MPIDSNAEEEAKRLERKARREERREKQRAANGARGEKMHQARIASEPTELFSPAVHEPPALNIGCSGWFYWHWRGSFYEAGLPSSQWFAHYAKSFRTVELNAPFYSWPTVATVNSWLRQLGGSPDFIYTVK